MAGVTAQMVKELRDRTNCGMLDCKKALQETDGDMEAAIEHLRKSGLAKQAKRADRDVTEGAIGLWHADDGKAAALVLLGCETDFAARNEHFQQLLDELTSLAGDLRPESAEALAEAEFPGEDGKSVEQVIQERAAVTGENMQLGGTACLAVDGHGRIGTYVHTNGKIAAIVRIQADGDVQGNEKVETLGHDLAMHVTATAPMGLSRDDVDPDAVAREREIFAQQARDAGKPDNIIDKIVDGRMGRFFEETCLLEQGFVKDPDTSVGKLVESVAEDIGVGLTVDAFERLQIGD